MISKPDPTTRPSPPNAARATAPSRIKPQKVFEAIGWLYGQYLKHHRLLLGVIVAAMILQTLAVVYFADFVQVLTNEMFNNPGDADLLGLCTIVVLVFAVRGITTLIQRSGTDHVMARATGALRLDLVKHLTKVEFAEFDRYDSGELSARIGNNINELREQLSSSFISSILGVFTLLGLLGYLLYLNFWLATIMLGAFSIIALGLSYINRLIKQVRTRALVHFADLSVELDSFIVNQRSLRLNNIQSWLAGQIAKSIKQAELAARRQGYLLGVLSPLIDVTIGLSIALTIALGFVYLRAGEMTAPAMTAFFFALVQLYNPVKRVANLSALLRTLSVTVGSIRWVFDLPLETNTTDTAKTDTVEASRLSQDIEFRGIGFAYPTARDDDDGHDARLLSDFSLVIPGGKMTMLLGQSGSGKSTIPALLTGLYNIQAGQILVGGQALDMNQRKQLRAHTSYVGQEIILQNESAVANLTPFAIGTSANEQPERIEQALEMVQLMQIDLVQNGEPLGPRGSKLSGGQRQRLALAQAIVAMKPIAIFDEPTSALDGATAHKMMAAIKTLRASMTTIMIVHDRSLIQYADQVIELADGAVTYAGTAAQPQ